MMLENLQEKIMRKIMKDGNDKYEELLNPVEIEKILEYSNGSTSMQKNSESKDTTKTYKIMRHIITVDGKDTIVEEDVEDPLNEITETDTNKSQFGHIEISDTLQDPDDIHKLEPSIERVTDYNIMTTTKTRKILRCKIIVDGKETILEEEIDNRTLTIFHY